MRLEVIESGLMLKLWGAQQIHQVDLIFKETPKSCQLKSSEAWLEEVESKIPDKETKSLGCIKATVSNKTRKRLDFSNFDVFPSSKPWGFFFSKDCDWLRWWRQVQGIVDKNPSVVQFPNLFRQLPEFWKRSRAEPQKHLNHHGLIRQVRGKREKPMGSAYLQSMLRWGWLCECAGAGEGLRILEVWNTDDFFVNGYSLNLWIRHKGRIHFCEANKLTQLCRRLHPLHSQIMCNSV